MIIMIYGLKKKKKKKNTNYQLILNDDLNHIYIDKFCNNWFKYSLYYCQHGTIIPKLCKNKEKYQIMYFKNNNNNNNIDQDLHDFTFNIINSYNVKKIYLKYGQLIIQLS